MLGIRHFAAATGSGVAAGKFYPPESIKMMTVRIRMLRSSRARVPQSEIAQVKTLLLVVAWCLLFVLCWPLALLAVLLWPLLWLLSIPFRLVSITVEAVFALLKTILFLPARLLGNGERSAGRVR